MPSGTAAPETEPQTHQHIEPLRVTEARVKVMRSHDYCHFEVSLAAAIDDAGPFASRCDIGVMEVDRLRKQAALLVDKAVEQYKIAKREAGKIEDTERELDRLRYYVDGVVKIPESDRSPQDLANLKEWNDRMHELSRSHRPSYNYEDEWDDDGQDD